jgi:hypothetical protein
VQQKAVEELHVRVSQCLQPKRQTGELVPSTVRAGQSRPAQPAAPRSVRLVEDTDRKIQATSAVFPFDVAAAIGRRSDWLALGLLAALLRKPAAFARHRNYYSRVPLFPRSSQEVAMNGIIYIIGLIVVILAVLSFFGLR